MDKPKLIVVGGPNGAGKSTLAVAYGNENRIDYLGADAIAKDLAPEDPFSVRIRASQIFLDRLRESIARQQSLIVESTLAGKSLRRYLRKANEVGYRTTVVFTFLDSAGACVDRVLQRKRQGGHDVPVEDINRRFSRTINNFWNVYRPLADRWVLYYNGGEVPVQVAFGYDDNSVIQVREFYELFERLLES